MGKLRNIATHRDELILAESKKEQAAAAEAAANTGEEKLIEGPVSAGE
jgi:hypothetical protein